ncbi:MAG: hypothetical protein CMD72_04755 [Gammaproteobacteria bacterium]|jgi:hypothetical protein|nr:hypothetical protein [Gammaproteobacteria bacterium]|tara:strand:+ start:50 stop:448 length:399 start_codon:yes stop_codon:yes gene_type:complete
MSFRIIQLEGLSVKIDKDKNNLSLSFIGAHIKKTMDDAEEKTLWKQNGTIEMRNISEISDEYNGNDRISSISVSYDFYIYKNILALPFLKKGNIDIEIFLENNRSVLNIICTEMEILLEGDPKYIKHIKKTE